MISQILAVIVISLELHVSVLFGGVGYSGLTAICHALIEMSVNTTDLNPCNKRNIGAF
jgi:hypothetical protein